jgi:hypothetical protein
MRLLNMKNLSRYAVVAAMAIGIGMVVMGSVFVAMGAKARGDIRDALVKEQVITSKDAPIPGVLVEDARTAKAQQDAIEAHTFGKFGPYSKMKSDDPNRATYLNGLTLRNSLNLAVVGFGVADLAIGTGAISIILGLIVVGFAIPVHVLVTRTLREHPKGVAAQAARG